MIKIALTGPSGSGKGYLSALLEKQGIRCLDTDKVVHDLYDDPAFARQIEKLLDADICLPKGGIDRRKLGRLVYGDPSKMECLLSAVYPEVRKICLSFLCQEQNLGRWAAAVDAPQLFEAGMERDFDLLIGVDAPAELRMKRIIARDRISEEEVKIRMQHQKSGEEYALRCDLMLYNTEEGIAEQEIQRLLAAIRLIGERKN